MRNVRHMIKKTLMCCLSASLIKIFFRKRGSDQLVCFDQVHVHVQQQDVQSSSCVGEFYPNLLSLCCTFNFKEKLNCHKESTLGLATLQCMAKLSVETSGMEMLHKCCANSSTMVHPWRSLPTQGLVSPTHT